MNIVNYIKDKGLKRTILVIYQYKIDIVIQKILYLFLKNKKLKRCSGEKNHQILQTISCKYIISKN